jgi:cytoskeleton protein RodZ
MSVQEQPPVELSQPPGVILRKARERAGLTLEAVAQSTLIPLSRLRALENDDYERVGVATFVLGYTRSYARFLGVDPAPLLQSLGASLPYAEPLPVQEVPVALALQVQRRPRSLFWPIVVAVVVILVVVAVIGINTTSLVSSKPAARPSSQTTAVASGTLSVPLPVSVVSSSAALSESQSSPAEEDPALAAALADEDFGQASGESEAQALAASPIQEQEAAGVAASPNATAPAADVLALTFNGDCWVEVTDASGKALIARLATSGDNLQLFGRAPFEVMLGDAAAVNSVTINGRVIDAAPRGDRKSRRLAVGP